MPQRRSPAVAPQPRFAQTRGGGGTGWPPALAAHSASRAAPRLLSAAHSTWLTLSSEELLRWRSRAGSTQLAGSAATTSGPVSGLLRLAIACAACATASLPRPPLNRRTRGAMPPAETTSRRLRAAEFA